MKLALAITIGLAACAHQQPTAGTGGGGGADTAPVPAPVRHVVDATLGATARIGIEHEGGATSYEASTTTKLELEVLADGTVKQTEVAIPIASLPAAVAQAASARGKITEAEVVLAAAGLLFEVEVGDTELTLDPSGKLVAEEHEAEEQGEDHAP